MKWHPNSNARRHEESTDKDFGTQLELFKLVPVKKRINEKLIISFLILAICGAILLFSISNGKGEEVQKNTDIISQGALLCDTKEQVVEFLQAVAGLPAGSDIPNVEGCGYLQFPVPAEWEYVEHYEDYSASATIIKAESPAFGFQYMYLEYVPKPGIQI